MDDSTRWLATAAEILHEPDPAVAADLLAEHLRRWGHAYLAVRAGSTPVPRPEDVRVHAGRPWRGGPEWARAMEGAGAEHPLYIYNALTRTAEPATLEGVIASGWPLPESVADAMDRLGFTRHQMTVPLSQTTDGHRDSFALVREDPFTEDDLARALSLQPVLAGLDAHVRLLAQVVAHSGPVPAPDAVRLTPRERTVLELVARGATVQGIAARLGISPRTVHKHQENLYRKLGASDRLSAVLGAQRLGLISSPEP